MKKVIQFILVSILILSITIFYYKFFDQDEVQVSITDEVITKTENNIIKNLKYEIRIEQDNDYNISSETSEIFYKNNVEFVSMKNVTAILKDKDKKTLLINSDSATYNNNNYDTNFENNVSVRYLNNLISADKMFLSFQDNYVSISDNVIYKGPMGFLEADNIRINLITKKIDIFMDDSNENIKISTSQ